MNVLFLATPGFDYATSQLIEGLWLLDKKGTTTNPIVELKSTQANTHHGAQVDDLIAISDEEALDNIGWADLIVYSSAGNTTTWSPSADATLRDPALKHKRVFLDGCDSDGLLVDPETLLLYFKREIRPPGSHQFKHGNIRSLTFGIYQFLLDALKPADMAQWERRDIDVSFIAFGGSNEARMNLGKFLRDAPWGDLNVEVHVAEDRQPLGLDEYHDMLWRSKVGINMIGAGIDTLRYWETPGHGAVLASFDITPSFFMRHPFEAYRHCVYFTSYQGLLEQVLPIVSDSAQWIRMRRAADQCVAMNSTKARASEFLEMCEEAL